MSSESFSEDDVVDAMCIWEALLEDEKSCESSNTESVYMLKKKAVGAYAMRQLVIEVLLTPIRAGWHEISDDFEDAFDWEYIPAFLSKASEHFKDQESWSLSYHEGVAIAKAVLTNK